MRTRESGYPWLFIFKLSNMSFLTVNRVNDFEVGTRKSELRSLKQEILSIQSDRYMRPSQKIRAIKDLRELASDCSHEYNDLCNNIRKNFI